MFTLFSCDVFLAALHNLRPGGFFAVTQPTGFAKTRQFEQLVSFIIKLTSASMMLALVALGFGTFEKHTPTEQVTTLLFTLLKSEGLPTVASSPAACHGSLTFKATDTARQWATGTVVTLSAVASKQESGSEAAATGVYGAFMRLPPVGSESRTWLDDELDERVRKGWATPASAVMCSLLAFYTGSAHSSGVEPRSDVQLAGGSNKLLAAVLKHFEKAGDDADGGAAALVLTAEYPVTLLEELRGPGPLTDASRELVTRFLEMISTHKLCEIGRNVTNATRATCDGGAMISALGGRVSRACHCLSFRLL